MRNGADFKKRREKWNKNSRDRWRKDSTEYGSLLQIAPASEGSKHEDPRILSTAKKQWQIFVFLRRKKCKEKTGFSASFLLFLPSVRKTSETSGCVSGYRSDYDSDSLDRLIIRNMDSNNHSALLLASLQEGSSFFPAGCVQITRNFPQGTRRTGKFTFNKWKKIDPEFFLSRTCPREPGPPLTIPFPAARYPATPGSRPPDPDAG
jgi:hypothetical protein